MAAVKVCGGMEVELPEPVWTFKNALFLRTVRVSSTKQSYYTELPQLLFKCVSTQNIRIPH